MCSSGEREVWKLPCPTRQLYDMREHANFHDHDFNCLQLYIIPPTGCAVTLGIGPGKPLYGVSGPKNRKKQDESTEKNMKGRGTDGKPSAKCTMHVLWYKMRSKVISWKGLYRSEDMMSRRSAHASHLQTSPSRSRTLIGRKSPGTSAFSSIRVR